MSVYCSDSPKIGAGYRVRGNLALDARVASRALPVGSGFDLRSSTSGGSCIVRVSGEVDTLTASVLRERLLGVLGRSDHSGDVVVDLSLVTFLSAAGLTALAISHQVAGRAGRVLRIRCGTARPVTRVLQITGLSNVFTIID